MNLPLLALLPWLGALLVACLPGGARRTAAWLAGVVALCVSGLLLNSAPALFGGAVLRWSVPWLPGMGLQLGLRLDGLAWMFALLIGGIGALVVLYAAWYLDADEPAPRFFSLLLLFMGAMLGVVLADNLLLLVLFWELTSVASFLLIGFWHRREDARSGALTALTVTGAGGLCLLAGVLLLGHMAGSMQLDVVLASGDAIHTHPLYPAALVLVLLGALTKSAQFPFHFWLPQAMAAPTPVSAYLHSATLVKAGIFLLARLYPALGGSGPWFWMLTLAGAATLLLGAWVALFQHDLKGLLAYSTLSHLGLITLLLGLGEPLALVAALFHTLNHAVFKAGLFMSAGIIDHACGTRDMRRINGLMKYMPVTALLGITAAAAMAGVPLLNGFLSKEMFFAETLTLGTRGAMAWLLPLLALLAGALGMAYSLRFVHDVFFNGEPVNLPRTPHEAPFFMRLPLLLLVALCLAVGVAPQWTVAAPLALAAQAALHGHPGPALPPYHLALWHGVNLPLLMSALALLLGAALYFGLQRVVNLHTVVRLPGWAVAGAREVFAAAQSAAMAGARGVTALLESGCLQHYLRWLLLTALAAGALPFLNLPAAGDALRLHADGLTPALGAVAAIGCAATLAVVALHRRRLVAVLMLGAVGLVVCLAFAWFSAPDLAITQLLVDMVAVLLMTQALRWLPQPGTRGARGASRVMPAIDAFIALGAGVALALLAWQVLAHPDVSIAEHYLQAALPLAGGANVVNVIIVDFRAFDTLGEITVMAIAALTLHALLGRFTPPPVCGTGTGAAAFVPADPPFLLHAATRAALPLALLLALHLFLRGHNLPGGGFAAALVVALALLLQRLAGTPAWGKRAARGYLGWTGAGLLLAVGTGAASWLWGAPFLTSAWDYPWLPGVGGVPLSSAMALDLGVMMVVLGAVMLMLHSLDRLSRRGT